MGKKRTRKVLRRTARNIGRIAAVFFAETLGEFAGQALKRIEPPKPTFRKNGHVERTP